MSPPPVAFPAAPNAAPAARPFATGWLFCSSAGGGGGGQPVATHADYSLVAKNGTFPGTTTVPARPGEIITLWGTGFGSTTPIAPAGQEPAVPGAPVQGTVRVTLGGNDVAVPGAVLSSYAGTYQIAIQIPAIADGDYPIVTSVNGVQSPQNLLTVHAQ